MNSHLHEWDVRVLLNRRLVKNKLKQESDIYSIMRWHQTTYPYFPELPYKENMAPNHMPLVPTITV